VPLGLASQQFTFGIFVTDSDEEPLIYRELPPRFFLVVVDDDAGRSVLKTPCRTTPSGLWQYVLFKTRAETSGASPHFLLRKTSRQRIKLPSL
jgi:hypothetical protein